MDRVRRRMLMIAATAGLLLPAACSTDPRADYGDLGLIEVTGRVTLDGDPLDGALVEFESPDLTASSGRTDRAGEYRLMFNSEQAGCLPGEKTVRISLRASGDEEDPDVESTASVVPQRYNTESQLLATVTREDRRFDFDLKSTK